MEYYAIGKRRKRRRGKIWSDTERQSNIVLSDKCRTSARYHLHNARGKIRISITIF